MNTQHTRIALSLLALTCGAWMLAAQATPGQTPAPAAPPAAAPPAPAAPSAPSAPATGPILSPTYEMQVLDAPSPTLSPTFGLRVAAAAGQFLVTGPVRTQIVGEDGQVMTAQLKGGIWTSDVAMWPVPGVSYGDFSLQRIAAGGNIFATTIERRSTDATRSSSVALFEHGSGGWEFKTALGVPQNLKRPGFGSALATDGARLAVNTVDLRVMGNKEAPIAQPEVFVFVRKPAGWELENTVLAPPIPHMARDAIWFGTSLALSKDVLAVGSPELQPARPHETMRSSGKPTVFVYRRNEHGWQPEAEIIGPTDAGRSFGNGVALDGDLLAVWAAPLGMEERTGHVYAYRFTEGKWKLTGELLPGAGITTGRAFGSRMAISEGRIVVCDSTASIAGESLTRGTGSVLVFELRDGTWTNTMRLQPQDTCGPGQFGQDVAVNGPWVAVGRIKNERTKIMMGGAFIYKLGM